MEPKRSPSRRFLSARIAFHPDTLHINFFAFFFFFLFQFPFSRLHMLPDVSPIMTSSFALLEMLGSRPGTICSQKSVVHHPWFSTLRKGKEYLFFFF